jgi:hypothetical protein
MKLKEEYPSQAGKVQLIPKPTIRYRKLDFV